MIVKVDQTNIHMAAAVHSASWQESHRSFCSAEFIALHTPERQKAYLLEKMARGSEIYMLVDGGPVGIVSVTDGCIEDLYVLPGKQNNGYGTELLQYAIKCCEKDPTLWILENNSGAERLYRRMGFRETGRRSRITDRLDEIEFSLRKDD